MKKEELRVGSVGKAKTSGDPPNANVLLQKSEDPLTLSAGLTYDREPRIGLTLFYCSRSSHSMHEEESRSCPSGFASFQSEVYFGTSNPLNLYQSL